MRRTHFDANGEREQYGLSTTLAQVQDVEPVVRVFVTEIVHQRAHQRDTVAADARGVDAGGGIRRGRLPLRRIETFGEVIQEANRVVWNGPMGVFEFAKFAEGTFAIARLLATTGATTVIGGGDSASAVKKAGVAKQMTHVSTGGGASLEFLEGRVLPGVAALNDR